MTAAIAHEHLIPYLFAGHATFTISSRKSGERFTYRLIRADPLEGQGEPPYFLQLLTGPSNTDDFRYLGVVFGQRKLVLTAKSCAGEDATAVKAFRWALEWVVHGNLTAAEICHDGTCGHCGRPLTVPESVARGIGPVCAAR